MNKGGRAAIKFLSFSLNRKVKLSCDVSILLASGYLMLKKTYDLSISEWMVENIFRVEFINIYHYVTGGFLSLAIVVKAVSLVLENFSCKQTVTPEPSEISECLGAVNQDLEHLLKKCRKNGPVDITKLDFDNSFDVNLRNVVKALSEHIRKSIKTIKVKKKDLFISLYSLSDSEEGVLSYELHYDDRRDLITNRKIKLSDGEFDKYECVKCMNSKGSTTYLLCKKEFEDRGCKRHKTVEQFLGCKIETNGYLYGFLSIEIHNNPAFETEEEMQDFMEESIFPFKFLLEYQYLKRSLIGTLKNFDQHWRVQ